MVNAFSIWSAPHSEMQVGCQAETEFSLPFLVEVLLNERDQVQRCKQHTRKLRRRGSVAGQRL